MAKDIEIVTPQWEDEEDRKDIETNLKALKELLGKTSPKKSHSVLLKQ